jgi:hypothetical protein
LKENNSKRKKHSKLPSKHTATRSHNGIGDDSYRVLTALVRDKLLFCNDPGAKRNINVDGIAYVKVVVEAQEALPSCVMRLHMVRSKWSAHRLANLMRD